MAHNDIGFAVHGGVSSSSWRALRGIGLVVIVMSATAMLDLIASGALVDAGRGRAAFCPEWPIGLRLGKAARFSVRRGQCVQHPDVIGPGQFRARVAHRTASAPLRNSERGSVARTQARLLSGSGQLGLSRAASRQCSRASAICRWSR